MPGFWSGIWSGSVRTVVCPACRYRQTVRRQPLPFEITCRSCRRPLRVGETGVVALSKD